MVSGARTPVNNASRGRFGEASAQFTFEDLAGGVARQVLHEEDVLGALEVRQLPSGVFFQLFAQVLSIVVFPGGTTTALTASTPASRISLSLRD